MTPFLLDDELLLMTHPVRQSAAQRRFLDRIGVPYITRPDGRPLVSREVLAGRLAQGMQHRSNLASNDEPNQAALVSMIDRGRRRKHG